MRQDSRDGQEAQMDFQDSELREAVRTLWSRRGLSISVPAGPRFYPRVAGFLARRSAKPTSIRPKAIDSPRCFPQPEDSRSKADTTIGVPFSSVRWPPWTSSQQI